MKNILVIGAGRSSTSLIEYLLSNSEKENWKVTVADIELEIVQQKTANHKNAKAIVFDINNDVQREEEIKKADLVISMLPAFLHLNVAKDCVKYKKNMATASYVSKEMAELDNEAKASGIILMNEIGLDPGIDHASAMKIIDEIHAAGGKLTSFKSYCGGLVAPEYNNNPWGYKFSWNPRNVILAGQGTAQFIDHGAYKYIPYNRLFKQVETIELDGYGQFEGYANRDSLSYRKLYQLDHIPTMLRGTLRMPGFCKAWNVFVKLGLTDDTYTVEASDKLTYGEFLQAYLPSGPGTLKDKLTSFMGAEMDNEIWQKLEWLDITGNRRIRLANATPAQILQDLLVEKWKLNAEDKDMIVMQHLIEYSNKTGENKSITSSLVVIGDDPVHTAMAKTVGIPLAIVSKLILQNKIHAKGVLIPTKKEIYEPVLKELESFGVKFVEKEAKMQHNIL
ncbi:MAG TPA: saccharopine dehydrogenase C-terminal domain-containing protein [Bacteroidia bacterium]|jgi:saccharopine dehydrogenase-like NADP-dependent oxidoreductase|nr:saccharopine dehydrogenase C-terminal domain-containing protein [Bacteroidia bacterium]